MPRPVGQRAAVAAITACIAGAVLAGCSQRQIVSDFRTRSTLYSDDSELLGSMAASSMRAVAEPSTVPSEWKVAARILDRLAQALPKSRRTHYRAFVVQLPFPNAFALPNGDIYVTDVLLRTVRSEDELAGIMGHEIGHVEKGHTLAQLDQSSLMGLINVLMNFRFDQRQELESDLFGVELARKAGYQPGRMADFFETMDQFAKTYGFSRGGFLSTHPSYPSRIEKVGESLTPAERTSKTAPQSSGDFKAMELRAFRSTREYSGEHVTHQSPEMLSLGDKASDARFLAAVNAVRAEYDMEAASKALSSLEQAHSKNAHARSAMRHWQAWIKYLDHDYAGALAEMTVAQSLWPESPAPKWLQVPFIASRDRDSSEGSEAMRLWRKLSSEPGCEESLECLKWSAFAAIQAGFDGQVVAEAAKRFRLAAIRNASAHGKGTFDSDALSRSWSMELIHDLSLPPERRTRGWELPEGFERTPAARDMERMSKAMASKDLAALNRESGLWFDVIFGKTGFRGDLEPLLGDPFTLTASLGLEFWPWIGGLKVRATNNNANPPLPDDLKGYNSSGAIGPYFGRLWGRGWLRALTTAHLSLQGILHEPDGVAKRQYMASSGWMTGLESAVLLRMTRFERGGDLWLNVAAGVNHSSLRPFAGEANASGWSYQLGAGITFRVGANATAAQVPVELPRQPPAFY